MAKRANTALRTDRANGIAKAMKKLIFLWCAALGLVQGSPAVAASADTFAIAPAEQTEGYERLYRVLVSDPGDLGARRLADITVELMGTVNPVHAEIEAANPGFEAALADALMPLVTRYMRRNRNIHEADFLAAVTPLMSEEEAVEVAEFYESELGQRMMRLSRQNYQLEMTNEQLLAEDDFTREDAQRSVEATRRQAMEQLSQEDFDAIASILGSNPRLLSNIMALREPMLTIRVSMDNEDMTGAEEAQMQEIYTSVLARYGY